MESFLIKCIKYELSEPDLSVVPDNLELAQEMVDLRNNGDVAEMHSLVDEDDLESDDLHCQFGSVDTELDRGIYCV